MYYHYTDITALVGMITTKKVWFSSLDFMNDAMEGLDLSKVLMSLLSNEKDTTNYEALIDLAIGSFLRFQYCFSATSLNDDLSQWRAYTNLGHGVCIDFSDGFFPEYLQPINCVYDDDEKREIVRSLSHLSKTDKSLNQVLGRVESRDAFFKELVEHTFRFKHSSFRPEKETRWVASYAELSEARDHVKYRTHRLGLASYVEIPINIQHIYTVTLGPQVAPQNSDTIEDFLMQNDCQALVLESEVTLR